ncbi:hypothetical protein EDB84DRAFT_1681860 [Lactarius hengduanensis]|nr:hypothetical protein EDB84DRAFT_1681860 [Lactarius hengduanensis]
MFMLWGGDRCNREVAVAAVPVWRVSWVAVAAVSKRRRGVGSGERRRYRRRGARGVLCCVETAPMRGWVNEPEAGPGQALLGRAKPSRGDGLETALARLRKAKSQSQRLKPGLWLLCSSSVTPAPAPCAPQCTALARGLSNPNPTRFRHGRFQVVTPNLAALARGLSCFNQTCFQYRRTHIRSFAPRRSVHNRFRRPSMTLPSRLRVVAPNLAAPVRGLHYPNQLRFQFRWTLRRSFAPRRSAVTYARLYAVQKHVQLFTTTFDNPIQYALCFLFRPRCTHLLPTSPHPHAALEIRHTCVRDHRGPTYDVSCPAGACTTSAVPEEQESQSPGQSSNTRGTAEHSNRACRGLSQAKPEPSPKWGLWLGLAFSKAGAALGQAKAGAFRPSRAGTSLGGGRVEMAPVQRGRGGRRWWKRCSEVAVATVSRWRRRGGVLVVAESVEPGCRGHVEVAGSRSRGNGCGCEVAAKLREQSK